MPPKKITGNGFMDVLRNPIQTLKEVISGPTKLNYISTETLNKHGNSPIMSMQIIRTPLSNFLTSMLNKISGGKFADIQKKYGYEKLFHLSLVIVTTTAKIIVEKNEVININLFKMSDVNNETENMPVNISVNKLTINGLINNTLKYMGDDKFYNYDGMGAAGKTNNCQNFILSILASNSLLTTRAKNFIYQDFTEVLKEIEAQKMSYLPKVVKKITDIASKASILIGKGLSKKMLTETHGEFIDFVKRDGFRFL